MKINKKDLTICFMTFTGTLFLLWLFLILSASIPNAKIQDNMVKSALVYAQEDAFSYCDGDKMNGIADNYADSIWLNVAWFMGKDNPILSTLDTQYYDGEKYGENIGLYWLFQMSRRSRIRTIPDTGMEPPDVSGFYICSRM